MLPRELVWMPAIKGAPHPAIVLEVLQDGAVLVVVSGTSDKDFPQHGYVIVSANTLEARDLELDKDTYFFVPVRKVYTKEVRPTGRKCSLRLFLKIREVADEDVENATGPGPGEDKTN